MNLLTRGIKKVWQKFAPALADDWNAALAHELAVTRSLTARLLIAQMAARGPAGGIRAAEFKVSSQFGDDGIIQYLIHHADVRPENHAFVEFGVEDYREANTRFLLTNNNWRGLVMDGSAAHVARIRSEEISWRYDLTAAAAFIDAENINDLIRRHGFAGEIGLLSVDIDGNDYWVWQAIDVVRPILVVAEYNSVFGGEFAVTIPYNPQFQRRQAHCSNLYWGASVKALQLLAERKGYAFLGCNSNGNNAYFVRTDRLGALTPVTLADGYVESRFREARDAQGRLTFVSGARRQALIEHLPLVDVERGAATSLRELQALKAAAARHAA